MSGRNLLWVGCLLVLLALGGFASAQTTSCSPVSHSEIGFASRQGLHDHFLKHGKEFRATSEEQYLVMAQTLRDAKLDGQILENVRQDGVVTRFDKRTRAFLARNANGTIRTFFKPNDGEQYYWRQLRR